MTKRCDNREVTDVPAHLYRRGDAKSANFYVRLIAPQALHAFLSPKEQQYRQSTGTADLAKARVVGAEMVARKLREWDQILASMQTRSSSVPVSLSEPLIQQICGARLQSWVETDNDERLGDEGLDNETLSRIEAFCVLSDQRMRSVLAQAKGSPNWTEVVSEVVEWCQVLGFDVDSKDPMFITLVRAFAKTERTAQKFIAARNEGDEPADVSIQPTSGARLSEVAPMYAKAKAKSVSAKSVSKNISIWSRLVDFLGDVCLDEVRTSDIYRFLEDRLFTQDEPWSQGYVDGHGKRALREIFSFARTLDLMKTPNPVLDLESTPKLPKELQKSRKQPRYPFTSEQVNTLLASTWYQVDSGRFKGKLKADLASRYWPPLIGLLHGCRVREYMQLTTSDIEVFNGVPCFHFRVDFDELAEDDVNDGEPPLVAKNVRTMPVRSVKTDAVIRRVPIHPKLIELGILDFVAERRRVSGQPAPLFESALPEPNGRSPVWGRAFEQSFGRYVKDILLWPPGYCTHSFRHQFEDRIRAAQATKGVWPAGLAQFLSGRKLTRDADKDLFRQEGSERVYGAGYKPGDVAPYLAGLTFDDIVFPAPYKQWLAGGAPKRRVRAAKL